MLDNYLHLLRGSISSSMPVQSPQLTKPTERTIIPLSSSSIPSGLITRLLDKIAQAFHSISSIIDSHEPAGNPLEASEVRCLRGKEKGSDPGKEITYVYENKGTIFGKETVERREAIKDLQSGLMNRIHLIKDTLAERSADPAAAQEIQQLEKELKLCQQAYANAGTVKDDFVKSSFYRDELKKVLNQRKNYGKSLDQMSLGAAVNFRYQKGEAGGKEIGFFRLGVITDPRNGFTHLEELKAARKNPQILQEKLAKLGTEYQHLLKEPKKNQGKLEAIQYALIQFSPQNLETTIREREFILENQMLQLVQGQVEKSFTKIETNAEQKTFSLVHLALLNRKTDAIDPTGWVHNEANEMADMNQIFKQFGGKNLIFDGKGPCIDLDGNLHLAQHLTGNDGEPRQMKLDTAFVNISVQGHTKNDGIQEQINTEGLAHLIEIANAKAQAMPENSEIQEGKTLLLAIQAQLKENKSNYQMAEDLSVALLKLGIPLSMGCLSAKDRTGYVGARTIFRFVSEGMKDHPTLKERPSLLNHLRRKFETCLLDKDACAARVVEDNTKVNVLKCSAFELPGYSQGILGKVRRLGYYLQQLAVTVTFPPKVSEFFEGLQT